MAAPGALLATSRGRAGHEWHVCPPPPCDIPSGCCSFTGPWTVTRSSLRMLRWGAAFCRPLRPVLLLVSFPRSRSPVIGVPGAVLNVACRAVCVSAAPNNWRIEDVLVDGLPLLLRKQPIWAAGDTPHLMPVEQGLPWHPIATGLAGQGIPFIVAASHAHGPPFAPFWFPVPAVLVAPPRPTPAGSAAPSPARA